MKYLKFIACGIATTFMSLSAYADDIPFREQRREVFRVTPVHEGDIVFLGNSITNFGIWPEMFGSAQGIVNRGISGIGSAEVAQHIDLIAKGKPSKLFIMLGINDFATPEVVVPSLRKIIKVMREESPETQIYVQSVLPCNLAARKAVVAPMNEEIQALCSELEMPYIDIYSLLADNGNPRGLMARFTNDNLHVLASGYREWTKELEEYVGHKTVWSDAANTTVNGLSTINNIRLSQYAMLPVNDGDVLMLGDYNVMTAEWQEMLSNSKVKNRGFGQAWGYTLTIDHLSKVIPHVVKGNPASVFVECGLKDLDGGSSDNVAGLWEKYRGVVEDILSRAPQAMVYVQSVIPSAFAANNTATIAPFNELMKEYAESTQRVEFIDLYGGLVDTATGALAEIYQGANTQQSHGINGRAYLRWCNLIAPKIEGAVSPAEPTDEEFMRNETLADAMAAMRGADGDSLPGGKPQAAVDALKEAIVAAQRGGNIADLEAALEKFNSSVILPSVSTDSIHYWYKLSTPLRKGTFMDVSNNALYSSDGSGSATQQWQFCERADGTYDIINRSDSAFVNTHSPYNKPVPMTHQQPSSGWQLSQAATLGLFIVYSGSVQLNRHNNGTIVNWGGGTNVSDLGCQFKIELVEKVITNSSAENPKEDEPDEESPGQNGEVPGQGEDQSSIREIDSEAGDMILFDLQGRRVKNPMRGIYISPRQKIIRL